jgi:phosphatidylinositol N-acetylglucosaminyltransferase subunit P
MPRPLVIYLLWSYLPSPFLHQLGIYYYPNRWWSLAIPAWLVMTLVYMYVALACYNTGYLTLPMTSIENIVDDAANIAVIDGKGRRRLGGSEKMKPGSATSQAMPTGQHRRMHASSSSNGGGGILWKEVWAESTDAVMDIPVGGVCEILYGKDREEDPELVEIESEEDEQSHYSRYARFRRQDVSHYEDSLRYRPTSAAGYSSRHW